MRIDHLMFAAADLDQGSDTLERLLGARPVPGGSHPRLGTRNALLGLGDGCYLELIAPQPDGIPDASFGAALLALAAPALVTFAVASRDLAGVAATLAQQGCSARGPIPTQRRTPDGDLLAWELLFPREHGFDSLCPFFIDWGSCRHPSADLPPVARLAELRLGSPLAGPLGELMDALDLPVRVEAAAAPCLSAALELPSGGLVLLESSERSVGLRFG